MFPELRAHRWLLGLLVAAACDEPQAQNAPPPAPVRVETVRVQQVPLESEYVGTVRSRDATDIRAKITGHITDIAVQAGQEVVAEQILMRIDQGRQQAMLSRARAVKASAVSDLARARASLTALQASRDAAAARVQFARKQRARVRSLFAADNASREQYERATTELEHSEAELSAMSAQLNAQRAEIASLEASVDESHSSVREGQAELSYYNVQAPIAGRLGDVPVRVGDLVTPNSLLTTLEGNTSREVYVQVPVGRRGDLRMGLSLQVLDDQGQVVATGQVGFVSPQVDERTQTVLIKAPLPADSPVAPGQYVRTRVVWEHESGPTLPPSAVLRVNTQPFAFVLSDASPPTVSQVPIALGPLHAGRFLVRSGLTVGQRVVVAGIQRLSDGVAVEIKQAPAAPAGTTGEHSARENGGPQAKAPAAPAGDDAHPAEPAQED